MRKSERKKMFLTVGVTIALSFALGFTVHKINEPSELLPLTGRVSKDQGVTEKKARLVLQPVYIHQGEKFDKMQAIVSAVDDKGKDVSENVVATTPVDTDKPGTNYVTFVAPYGDAQYISSVGMVVVLED
ncbi:MAG: DUF5011 domain-containing protein [Streptococcaceae bacterium]|jgi:hypothetical protein|nr:DUF5011 domain-containing protein [Streptococcaceae bacterium]